MLWAAGVLGALAIIIAVLIVINSHGDTGQPQPSAPTVTDTGTPGNTTAGSAPAHPSNWTHRGVTGNPGRQSGQPTLRWVVAPTYPHDASLGRHEKR
ncbi:MAG: serine/threonine-protein kinase [Mycobacterium sp.]|nr:serine/threonine-protein kinase [Mycobacterium sp.]